ncbi:MAG TPA: ribonuclease H-like domain-containing protein [Vicinamibacterales bacterium]|nr:ribonuclease H-like domain-containing protein [Vicinamibacterales bacterium]
MSTLADRLRGVVGPPEGGPYGDGSYDNDRRGPLQPAQPDASDVLGGDWCESRGRKFLVVDRRFAPGYRHGSRCVADCLPPWPRLDLLANPHDCRPGPSGCRPGPFGPGVSDNLLFLDLETTGLAGGAGTYAFLVGCGWFDPPASSSSAGQAGSFHTRQFFLADFAAERALLESVTRLAGDFSCVVTYNGKAFDLPLMETRFALQRMATPFAGVAHVDLLHPARRMWREDDVECRLTYLEQALCGHEREGDVPGFEIPSRYFRYVRSGDARPLEAVLEHNRLDIVSLAMLTAHASQLLEDGPSSATTPREAFGMGCLYARAGMLEEALASFERAKTVEGVRAYAILLRRLRRYEAAAAAWRELLGMRGCPPGYAREATEALAVHHEHRVRDLDTARSFALQALPLQATPARQDAVKYRLARIDRKLGARALPCLPLA